MPPKKKQQKKPTKKPAKKTKSQNQGNFFKVIVKKSGIQPGIIQGLLGCFNINQVVLGSLMKPQTVDYRKASRAKGS